MTTIKNHPMDAFPVRPLQFDLGNLRDDQIVWSRTCPEFSVFINALGLHIPHFERYLIRSMRAAKEHITDEALRRDISAIIGQEAHHARNFVQFNAAMAKRYPKVGRFDADSESGFIECSKTESLRRKVGFTAGFETFTFLAGIIILENHDRWFADADPTMKAIWVWHQVEEVEHGAVAFEVYHALYGEQEWYRKWMVLVAALHIAGETIKAYVHMARVEGWLRNPLKAISTLSFCATMLTRLFISASPVFRRNYHPRRHPVVTTKQNAIQIAWRRFAGAGGNVLEIDHRKMAEILGIDAA